MRYWDERRSDVKRFTNFVCVRRVKSGIITKPSQLILPFSFCILPYVYSHLFFTFLFLFTLTFSVRSRIYTSMYISSNNSRGERPRRAASFCLFCLGNKLSNERVSIRLGETESARERYKSIDRETKLMLAFSIHISLYTISVYTVINKEYFIYFDIFFYLLFFTIIDFNLLLNLYWIYFIFFIYIYILFIIYIKIYIFIYIYNLY